MATLAAPPSPQTAGKIIAANLGGSVRTPLVAAPNSAAAKSLAQNNIGHLRIPLTVRAAPPPASSVGGSVGYGH